MVRLLEALKLRLHMILLKKSLFYTVQHLHHINGGQEDVSSSFIISKFLSYCVLVGHSANYAVVLAQLYTKGKCHGIHPFIVQLRDEETHEPLLGIKIGEIGCKLGMNSTNNGYLGFEEVRIPRTNLLMKNSQVLSVSMK